MRKRVALKPVQRKQIRLREGEQVYVGVDVHKKSFDVALWSMERGLVTTWHQGADGPALIRRLERHRDHIQRVVYEAGPTGYGLVRLFRAKEFNAEVVVTSKIPSLPGPQPKTDRLDCGKLAEYACLGLLEFVRVPKEQEEADRQITRLRGQVLQRLQKIKNQIKSFLLMHSLAEPAGLAHWSKRSVRALGEIKLSDELRFCLDMLVDDLSYAEKQLNRANKRIDELAASERHVEEVGYMRSVSGVGVLTAITYRTELVAPERFNRGAEVARALGLAPGVHKSGGTDKKGKCRLLKSGNQRLRKMLIEAAWRWVANDGAAKKRYQKLRQKTGNSKKAVAAMARRLGILLWRLSTRGESYRAVV